MKISIIFNRLIKFLAITLLFLLPTFSAVAGERLGQAIVFFPFEAGELRREIQLLDINDIISAEIPRQFNEADLVFFKVSSWSEVAELPEADVILMIMPRISVVDENTLVLFTVAKLSNGKTIGVAVFNEGAQNPGIDLKCMAQSVIIYGAFLRSWIKSPLIRNEYCSGE